MTGIILMLIGFLIFVVGVFIYFNTKHKSQIVNDDNELEKAIEMAVADGVLTPNERQIIKQLAEKKGVDYDEVINNIENRLLDSDTDSETAIIDYNKKNGDDFEKFIVQKFSKTFFKIKEWAGDKYIDGRYAQTTLQPDILLEFKLKQQTRNLSVECKWRKKLYNNGVEFATKEQLERYKNFQKTTNIPVFVAIGIGGKGMSPEQLFIVPLNDIQTNFLNINQLSKYKKKVDSKFFYDNKTNILK